MQTLRYAAMALGFWIVFGSIVLWKYAPHVFDNLVNVLT